MAQQQPQQPKRVRVAEGSCWPCKDRRVLCDLAKPACAKCVRTNQECAYGKVRLKWGRSGSSRTASASAPTSSSPSSPPSSSSSTPPPASVEASSASSPSLALSTTVLSPLDNVGDWQMSYFEGEILPLFSLSDGLRPGAQWASANPSLRQAVVAVANAHRLVKQHTTTVSYLQESMTARNVAIKSLREQLSLGFTGPSKSDQTFLVNVMLCILDGMVEPSEDYQIAQHHLQGGIAILNHTKDPKGAVVGQKGIRPLMYSVFATMDLSSAILNGQAPHFEFEWWNSFSGKEAWWNGLQNDKGLLTIMGSMSRMAMLGNGVRFQGKIPVLEELAEIQSILTSTAAVSIKEESPSPPSSPSEDPGAVADFIFISAFRAAAKLYLYRALCNLSIDDAIVQDSIDEGIGAFGADEKLGKLGHCLIFPGLVVGAHCRDPEHRRIVLKSLQGSMAFLSFGSVKLIIDFLLATWAKENLAEDWWALFRPIAGFAFFF